MVEFQELNKFANDFLEDGWIQIFSMETLKEGFRANKKIRDIIKLNRRVLNQNYIMKMSNGKINTARKGHLD